MDPFPDPDTKSTGQPPSAATQPRRCRFVVTGFGPFAGVPDNPTSVLVRLLRGEGSTLNSRNITGAHILETSAGYVRDKIDEMYANYGADGGSASGDKTNGSDDDDVHAVASNNANGVESATIDEGSRGNESEPVIFLHLGVNYRGTQFQLEQCAYNDATFRVPDERGYQPKGECILKGGNGDASPELGRCLNTTLDVHELCRELQKQDEDVMVSTDPGRFVCNYTYCLSLDRCRSANKHQPGDDDMKQIPHAHKAHTLFIHVPPFDVVPEKKQYDFILKVMAAIERQVSDVESGSTATAPAPVEKLIGMIPR